MVSEFLLLFDYLNLSSSSENNKKKVMKKVKIIIFEVIILFEYGKANKKYWDRFKLH